MVVRLLPEGDAQAAPSLLFVYGTLRRGFNHPMARLLARHARYLGGGSVSGRLYRVGTYPALVEGRHAHERVRGELYLLDNEVGLLKRLDRYEGLSRSRRGGGEYQRVTASVYRDDGSTTVAWLYHFRRSVNRLPRLASGDFRRERRCLARLQC